MSNTGPMLRDEDFARLSFGDKITLSLALFKSYGLKILGLVVAASFLLGFLGVILMNLTGVDLQGLLGRNMETQEAMSALSRLAFIGFVMAVFYAFISLGLNSLILRYAEGNEPDDIWPPLLAPWSRFSPVALTIFIWLTLIMVYNVLLSMSSGVPYLGLVMEILGSVVLSAFVNCALFFGADKLSVINPALSLSSTWAIVSRSLTIWLQTVFMVLLLNLPGLIMVMLGLGSRFGYLGRWATLLILAGLSYCLAVSVFGMFLMALTYRQSKAVVFPVSDEAGPTLN